MYGASLGSGDYANTAYTGLTLAVAGSTRCGLCLGNGAVVAGAAWWAGARWYNQLRCSDCYSSR